MKAKLSLYSLILLFTGLIFVPNQADAQLFLKLQWMEDTEKWGVFVRHDTVIKPSNNVFLGSGQITVVAPRDFEVEGMQSHLGRWVLNARANSPDENPDMSYLSFGIIASESINTLGQDEENLIISFGQADTNCPDTLYLIDENDPFLDLPNSLNTNPGNDLQMVDIGNQSAIYTYSANFNPFAWNCSPNDDLSTSTEDFAAFENSILVFPNPFQGEVSFEFTNGEIPKDYFLRLYDSFGKLVFQNQLNSNLNAFQIPNSQGIYFYQILDVKRNRLLTSGKLIGK